MVSGDGPVPAPPPGSGTETQEPPCPLLAVTHHVCEVPHHLAQIAPVDVRKETGLKRGVWRVFEGPTGRLVRVLNRGVAVQAEHRNVGGIFAFGIASKIGVRNVGDGSGRHGEQLLGSSGGGQRGARHLIHVPAAPSGTRIRREERSSHSGANREARERSSEDVLRFCKCYSIVKRTRIVQVPFRKRGGSIKRKRRGGFGGGRSCRARLNLRARGTV